MMNVASLIDSFGGNAKFARAIDVAPEHAGVMKQRASIPVRYWHRVIAAAADAGTPITYEQLVEIHVPREPEAVR